MNDYPKNSPEVLEEQQSFQLEPPVEEEAFVDIQPEQEYESVAARLNAWHTSQNIAEELEQTLLDKIGHQCVEDYDLDRGTRSDWDRQYAEIMELAKLVAKKKTWAGEVVNNVKFPLIAGASIQFAARAYPAIVKGKDVVKFSVTGADPDGNKAARGQRLAEHMSDQLLNRMGDWEDDVDQLLCTLPVIGCCFKKTYYDGLTRRNVSEMVFPDELIVDYYAKSVEEATRLTHVLTLTQNEIVEKMRRGVFLDIPVDDFGTPMGDTDDDGQAVADDEAPHVFLEQHRWWDLDDDGYREPYIVTVHRDTEKVVRITARFDMEGVEFGGKGEIVCIRPVHYFTRYIFLPSPDGSFYGMGFGSLLQPLNETINTTLNQLLDAGTLANRQGGFLGAGLQIGRGRGQNQNVRFKSGEWKQVKSTGPDLRANIVPLPVKEPSSVLFQLLGLMIETGKEFSAMTDVLSGESPGANASPTTTLALIEQGLKVFTGIYKRIHRAFKSELQKLRRLNRLFLDDMEYAAVLDQEAVGSADYADGDYDITPVSDPTNASDTTRILKAEALLRLIGQGFNDNAIRKRYLEALQIEDVDELLPPEGQSRDDPLLQLEAAKKQKEVELMDEKIRSERTKQYVETQGVVLSNEQLKIDKAKALSDIQAARESEKIKKADAINRMRGNQDAGSSGSTVQGMVAAPGNASGDGGGQGAAEQPA